MYVKSTKIKTRTKKEGKNPNSVYKYIQQHLHIYIIIY